MGFFILYGKSRIMSGWDAISQSAYRYQGMLKNYTSSVTDLKALGNQLFHRLVEIVYDNAIKKTNWIIVPDKQLFYLPFAALVNEQGQLRGSSHLF